MSFSFSLGEKVPVRGDEGDLFSNSPVKQKPPLQFIRRRGDRRCLIHILALGLFGHAGVQVGKHLTDVAVTFQVSIGTL